ncbi:hypothetical protein SK128_014566 [Halocaridina rubra]|uniref:Uncharacterized protein n=1 Tax=Halocaridina rubra TaxID=373956 RepID=A0AAN8X257_HALRR
MNLQRNKVTSLFISHFNDPGDTEVEVCRKESYPGLGFGMKSSRDDPARRLSVSALFETRSRGNAVLPLNAHILWFVHSSYRGDWSYNTRNVTTLFHLSKWCFSQNNKIDKVCSWPALGPEFDFPRNISSCVISCPKPRGIKWKTSCNLFVADLIRSAAIWHHEMCRLSGSVASASIRTKPM